MAVSYKDINQLTQKSSVSGTEKLPVSDTEFITPGQITDIVTSEVLVKQSGTWHEASKILAKNNGTWK